MTEQKPGTIDGPKVSVIVPTYNRPQYLAEALASAVRQSYSNLQIIVVNDGGCDVSDVVKGFSDNRIKFIDRKENRGKAHSLNEAISAAEGKYIAYLDDDDIYYPNHIVSLVDALEKGGDCQAAYSDLYKTYCRVMPDGSRQVLAKVVEISRDFDRFFILYFNHVLHVSLMHTRGILEKTGLYNENLNVLIDWDMTKRLVFFTDFYHVGAVTGEFYSPVGDNDRISFQRRKNTASFAANFLSIRTTRPAKPWPKLKDLSIIFIADRLDRLAGKTIGSIWQQTFYPYKLYVPVPRTVLNEINTDMPNLVCVPIGPSANQDQQIDAVLRDCEGDFVAIVPAELPVEEMWVEEPLYALVNNSKKNQAYQLESSTEQLWSAVFRKEELLTARKKFPHTSVQQSVKNCGITVRKIVPEEIPFQFDSLLKEGKIAGRNGNWSEAAEIFQYIADHYKNQLWMKSLAAGALYKAGEHGKAAELAKKINACRPTVDTLLLEAKMHKKNKNFPAAIELLQNARGILEGDILDGNN
jgi:glycosyltransferase involved in cell wall biosynthesis